MSHLTGGCGGRHLTAPVSFGKWIESRPAPVRHPMVSDLAIGRSVVFPEFTGERIYMQPLIKTASEVLLPSNLARWVPTVSAMLEGIETKQIMYLMVDQSEVVAGNSHRRSGAHIDGNWVDGDKGEFDPSELLILASDVQGCAAYLGRYFINDVRAGGDCSHMKLRKFKRVMLEPNIAYVCTVTTIHESIPIDHDCKRTLVRINVPLRVK